MRIKSFWLNRLGLHNFILFLKNNNWKTVIPNALFLLGIKKKITFLGFEFKGNSNRWLMRNLMGLEKMDEYKAIYLMQYLKSIFEEQKNIEFGGFKFKYLQPILWKEVFMNEDYNVGTPVIGDVLLDIGGNVGDTAIYFASKGWNVITIEPVKDNFDKMMENLMINNTYADKIKAICAAVGINNEKTNIFIHDSDCGSCSSIKVGVKSVNVNTLVLQDLIKQYNPSVIKMDCEGCEEALVLGTDFTGVSEMFIEVHPHLGIDKKAIIEELEKNYIVEENYNILHCMEI